MRLAQGRFAPVSLLPPLRQGMTTSRRSIPALRGRGRSATVDDGRLGSRAAVRQANRTLSRAHHGVWPIPESLVI